MSALETEATGDTAAFEMFGRTWNVPVKRHHKHIRQTKAIIRTEGSLDADDVAEIYLSPSEYDALVELNVTGEDLAAFANKVAEVLGIGDSGNSQPSPASS